MPLTFAAVVLIVLILISVTALRGKPLHIGIHILAATTMFAAGIASLLVTLFARSHKNYDALSGLLGVTTIMIVPIAVVVITHIVSEKTTAHFVFSHIVVYYLMFLPVGAWLILPAGTPESAQNAKTDETQISHKHEENGS